MRPIIKKIACIATSALLGMTLLVGCTDTGATGTGKNTDDSFSMVATWTSSGLVNHYDSNTNCNAFDYFVVEGLWRYVRSTDEIFCQLAAELPTHSEAPIETYKDVMGADAYEYYVENGATTVPVTTGKIREDAKWQNGEDFTAKDVWAYYYIIHPTSSNYMAAVNVVDDKTVEFVWNPLKEPADTVKEPFQYIFDREEITLAANPYATTSYYPLMGMAESEARTYMSEEHFNALPKYSYNQEKAAELLEAEGWTKRDGLWYDANGEQVRLTLGAPSTHDISSTAAEAAAAQLTTFGITIDLLKSSNYYSNATAENSPYDLTLEWTDLNMSFSYPTGSYSQFSSVYSQWVHVERYPTDYEDPQKAGNVKLVFNGLDGDTNTYEFADYINSFYSVDEEELTYLVDVFNTGLAELDLGIQFFQNVTASTLNVGKVSGVPLQDYWSQDRNVTYVPEAGTDDFFEVARTNLVYATNYMFINGVYQPNRA